MSVAPGEFYAPASEGYWNLMLLGRRKPTRLLKSQPKRLYRSLAKFRRLQPESLKTGKAVGLGEGSCAPTSIHPDLVQKKH